MKMVTQAEVLKNVKTSTILLGISEGIKTMNFEMTMMNRYNWNNDKRDSFKAKCLLFFGSQIKKTGLIYGMYEGIVFTSNLSYSIECGIKQWLQEKGQWYSLVVEGEYMGFYGSDDEEVFTESWWGYPKDLLVVE
jgi:hypothetical protein